MAAPTSCPLPPTELRFMGESDERLVEIGSDLAQLLYGHGLDARTGTLLDVGCGYGRLAIGLRHTGFDGRYTGFDVLGRQVAWCRQNLGGPRYRFRHHDVANSRYNPGGSGDAATTPFPSRSGAHQACALFSVFTHMHEAEIRHYLREIHRVLVPGGTAVTTWFLFDEQRLPAVTSDSAAFPLRHRLGPRVRYESEADPLKAIGYHRELVREMVEDAGLRPVTEAAGGWAGDVPSAASFQDVVVLGRPVTVRNRVGRALRATGLR